MLAAATNSVSGSTVLISVLSSATVGGIIVAVLTGHHERDQQLRDKTLAAAADFATSVGDLRAQLKTIDQDTDDRVLQSGARDAALAKYESCYEQASAQLVLVQILYNPRSKVYVEAGTIWGLTATPIEARQFFGDPKGRNAAIGGGMLTA